MSRQIALLLVKHCCLMCRSSHKYVFLTVKHYVILTHWRAYHASQVPVNATLTQASINMVRISRILHAWLLCGTPPVVCVSSWLLHIVLFILDVIWSWSSYSDGSLAMGKSISSQSGLEVVPCVESVLHVKYKRRSRRYLQMEYALRRNEMLAIREV